MRRYKVDCRKVTDFEGFIDAFNRDFVHKVGGHWNGNLDAFNDYLAWPEEERYELELIGCQNLETALDHQYGPDPQTIYEVIYEVFEDQNAYVCVIES